ncbi:MAG: hydantoinase B/oxoprolinase family protein, partial [Pseudomonadota bacterium]
ALRPDSAGPGMHRGGLGAIYEVEVLAEGGAEATLFGERGLFAPQGIAGGDAAAKNAFAYSADGAWHAPPMASKMRGTRLSQGEAVRLETPGGGGYGPPAARAPAAIARDVARGLLTEGEADRRYRPDWRGSAS